MKRKKKADQYALKRHKASDRAYCVVGGKYRYFGKFGSAGADEKYRAFLVEVGAVKRPPSLFETPHDQISLVEVISDYLDHTKKQIGELHPDYRDAQDACAALIKSINANMKAMEFGCLEMEYLHRVWKRQGLSMAKMYRHTRAVKAMFFWASLLGFKGPALTELSGALRSLRRRGLSTQTRWEVFSRDCFRCVYCGANKEEGVKLEVDHVVPVSRGGSNEMDNLVTACWQCNSGKSNHSLPYGM